MTTLHPFTSPLATGLTAEAQSFVDAGLAASQSNNAQEALRLFGLAAVASPSSPLPPFLRGSELASFGRVDDAEAAFANAVLLAPGFHIARYQLGLLQFSSGRAAVGLVTWHALFALTDADPLLHFVRGFAALTQDRSESARAHFNEGLSRDGGNASVAADIRKVLDRMDAGAAGASSASATPEPARVEPSANHILIANYGKSGTMH